MGGWASVVNVIVGALVSSRQKNVVVSVTMNAGPHENTTLLTPVN